MTPDLEAVEKRLSAGYEQQSELYAKALALVERHAPGCAVDLNNIDWADQLNGLLAQVAAVDGKLADDKRVWRAANRPNPPRLQSLLDRLASDIRTLSGRIDPMISDLQQRRNRLMPDLELFSRQRQMIEAYASSARGVR